MKNGAGRTVYPARAAPNRPGSAFPLGDVDMGCAASPLAHETAYLEASGARTNPRLPGWKPVVGPEEAAEGQVHDVAVGGTTDLIESQRTEA